MAHAAEDLDVVLLDLLPRAAAVAGLAAGEVAADRLAVDLEPRRQPGTITAVMPGPCDSPEVTRVRSMARRG